MGDSMGFPAHGDLDRGWKLSITSLAMLVLAGVLVTARCAIRYRSPRLGWDDGLVFVSLLSSIALSVGMHLAVKHGYGRHAFALGDAELRQTLKFFFGAQVAYMVTISVNKLSLILLYLRIFVTPRLRLACLLVIACILAWTVAAVTACVLQCLPIAGAWDASVDARCINIHLFFLVHAGLDVLSDVVVVGLPVPAILSLQLKPRDKTMLFCVFAMGGLVTVTSILRTVAIASSIDDSDSTWTFVERGIWTIIEANAGIISACMVVLWQPLVRLVRRLFAARPRSPSPSSSVGDRKSAKVSVVSDGHDFTDLESVSVSTELTGTTRTAQHLQVRRHDVEMLHTHPDDVMFYERG